VNYEAQAAIELEALIDSSEPGHYALELDGNGVLDPAPALRQLVADRRAGVPPGIMAARFHRGVSQAVVEVCRWVRSLSANAPVALSGGVWQNVALLQMTVPALRRQGFEVLLHRKVPANDGGVALGQVAVAATRLMGG
jgi:hydrogenase maturation protein HypF